MKRIKSFKMLVVALMVLLFVIPPVMGLQAVTVTAADYAPMSDDVVARPFTKKFVKTLTLKSISPYVPLADLPDNIKAIQVTVVVTGTSYHLRDSGTCVGVFGVQVGHYYNGPIAVSMSSGNSSTRKTSSGYMVYYNASFSARIDNVIIFHANYGSTSGEFLIS